MYFKKTIIASAVLPLFLMVSQLKAQTDINSVLATVNNEVITQNDFDLAFKDTISELNSSNAQLPEQDVLRRQVMNNLINERLQLQVANRYGIEVSREEIDRSINQIARSNNLSYDELIAAMKYQSIDLDRFRDRIESQIKIQKLAQRQFYSNIDITEQDVENFLKRQNQENFIYDFGIKLLSISYGNELITKGQALGEMKAVLDRVRKGESFDLLVNEFVSKNAAYKGRDLGIVNGANLPKSYFNALQNIKEGEFTSIFEDNNSYNILKLVNLIKPIDKQLSKSEEYRLAQIVIDSRRADSANALSREMLMLEVDKIYSKLESGEAFENLAYIYSSDLETKQSGGDMGWLPSQAFEGRLASDINTLSKGEYTKPLLINGRFYIYKLIDKRVSKDSKQLESARAKENLRQRKVEEAYRDWLRDLRKNAIIDIAN